MGAENEPGTAVPGASRTPQTLRVGVVGHRRLPWEGYLRTRVRAVLRRLDRAQGMPYTLVVVSPLAEGADRLVAKEALAWKGSRQVGPSALEAELPVPEADYLQDFSTPESQDEFRQLLAQATLVHVLEGSAPRRIAYERVGRRVVDRCDALIAVWDGKPSRGRGGTAEVVDYARQVGRPLFWVHPGTGRIRRELNDRKAEAHRYLEEYEHERLDGQLEKATEVAYNRLVKEAKAADLAPEVLEPLREKLLPDFVRAALLAERYQSRFKWAGSAIYGLSALAVAVVPVQTLYLQWLPQVLWIEVAAMASILALLWASHRGEWHRKWIDYRFLAERLRAALFLYVAGVDCMPIKPALPPTVPLGPEEWLVNAFQQTWKERPPGPVGCNLPLRPLRDFVASAWIRDQARYYATKGGRHRQRYDLLERVGAALFSVTLLASALHALSMRPQAEASDPGLSHFLVSVAIVLPAVGAAVAGIRVHREYQRNAERYQSMVRALAQISDSMEQVQSHDELMHLLEQANDVMLRENQDWRVVFGFHELTT